MSELSMHTDPAWKSVKWEWDVKYMHWVLLCSASRSAHA